VFESLWRESEELEFVDSPADVGAVAPPSALKADSAASQHPLLQLHRSMEGADPCASDDDDDDDLSGIQVHIRELHHVPQSELLLRFVAAVSPRWHVGVARACSLNRCCCSFPAAAIKMSYLDAARLAILGSAGISVVAHL
jgi:hypothetical protein